MGWGKVAEKLANVSASEQCRAKPISFNDCLPFCDQLMRLASILCEEESLLVPKGQGDLAAEQQEPEL